MRLLLENRSEHQRCQTWNLPQTYLSSTEQKLNSPFVKAVSSLFRWEFWGKDLKYHRETLWKTNNVILHAEEGAKNT